MCCRHPYEHRCEHLYEHLYENLPKDSCATIAAPRYDVRAPLRSERERLNWLILNNDKIKCDVHNK